MLCLRLRIGGLPSEEHRTVDRVTSGGGGTAREVFRTGPGGGLWLGVTALLLCVTARPAEAREISIWGKEITLSLTTTLSYEYRADNDFERDRRGQSVRDVDDKLHYIFSTFDLALSHGPFRLGGRFDLHIWADTFFQSAACPGAASCNERDTRFVDDFYLARDRGGDPGGGSLRPHLPERLFISISKPSFELTIGDFYASFGRGIALNVVKLDEIGQDTTVRGGKVSVHRGPLHLTLLAGVFNFLDVDQATGYLSAALFPEEPVFGGRIAYRLFENLELGAHAVHVVHVQNDDDNDTVWGVSADMTRLLGGDLSISAEMDLQRSVQDGCVTRGFGEDEGCSQRRFLPYLHPLRGLAAYLTSTLSRGNWVFNVEGKYFNDFAMGIPVGNVGYGVSYSQPPTLERIYANATDLASSAGGRLRVDYNFGELGPLELMVFANYTFIRTYGEGPFEIHDPYGGFELSWMGSRSHWNLMGGLRYERDTERSVEHRSDWHLYGDIEQALAQRHSVQLNYFLRFSRKESIGDWVEMDLAFQYRWSPLFALAFTVEHTGDPSVVGTTSRFFFGGSLRYFVTSDTYLNLRAGQNRPGLKCLNGLCRRFPGFSGLQVMAVGRL